MSGELGDFYMYQVIAVPALAVEHISSARAGAAHPRLQRWSHRYFFPAPVGRYAAAALAAIAAPAPMASSSSELRSLP